MQDLGPAPGVFPERVVTATVSVGQVGGEMLTEKCPDFRAKLLIFLIQFEVHLSVLYLSNATDLSGVHRVMPGVDNQAVLLACVEGLALVWTMVLRQPKHALRKRIEEQFVGAPGNPQTGVNPGTGEVVDSVFSWL